MLDDISVFISLVEAGGFNRASEQLNISQATISRRIAKLENTLDKLLFIRDTRNMILTKDGLVLYNRFKSVNKDLANYLFESKSQNHKKEKDKDKDKDKVKKTLTVCLHGAIAHALICPYLKHYTLQFPNVNLNLVFYSVDLINHLDFNFDVGISNRVIENSNYIIKPVRNDAIKLYCPPQYLINHQLPRTLEELQTHNVIGGLDNSNYSLTEISMPIFINKYTHEKNPYPAPLSQIKTNSASHAKQIGISYGAIFYCWESMCEQDVLDGKLVPVLPEYEIEANGVFYIMYEQNISHEATMFCEFIYNCMKKNLSQP